MDRNWRRADYRIGKNNNSSYDLIKHDSHMPHTPLYRPGQEIREADKPRYYESRRDMDNEVNNNNNGLTKMASGPLSIDLEDNEDQEELSPRNSFREDPRYGSGQPRREAKGFTMGGEKRGSYTDRQVGRETDYGAAADKPWTHRAQYSPASVVDPRVGNNGHSIETIWSGRKNGGALLFIRFPTGSGPGRTENIGVACQAFLRSKTRDMGGKFLGIAKSVHDFGYPSSSSEAIGVYHFPSMDKAKMFFQFDMTIRQPDFPPPYGHSEIWTVSNAYLPDDLDEYNTFLLSEVMLYQGRDKREFFEIFQKPFEKYLHENEVMPFVVCSYGNSDRECLRRHAYPYHSIVTCHLFKGQRHLKWLTNQELYLKFRALHNQMAEERCTVFTIERNLCP